jgi:propionyl-CoA carboxylase alpha chain
MVTGVDIVKEQIRIARGRQLRYLQENILINGWAIECRINAEDPFRSFLPSTGRLVKFRPPEQTMEASLPVPDGGGVRVDTGVVEGGEIPMYYDSMIAKLVVHGTDRLDAIRRMREALNAFVIRGISSNIPFQAALLAHPKFVSGEFNTGFIAEQYPKGFSAAQVPHDDPDFVVALVAAIKRRRLQQATALTGQLRGHEMAVREEFVVVIRHEGGRRTAHPVRIQLEDGVTRVTVGDRVHAIRLIGAMRDVAVHGEVDGVPFCAQIERHGIDFKVTHNGLAVEARVLSPRGAELYALMPHKPPPDLSRFLLSPMPGLLVDVAVQPGQKVLAGERLAVIEAMKMENILFASQDVVVKKVAAGKGDSLAVDQVILEFE